jgi:hypothetical protein
MMIAANEGHLLIVEYVAARGANDWDYCIARADIRGHSLVKDFLEQCREQQPKKN